MHKSPFLCIVLMNLIVVVAFAQDDTELYRKATDLYYQGKYEQALVYIDSAISINSDDISKYFYRSMINEKLDRLEDAISDLSVCIRKSDHDATYLSIRADYYERMGKEALALEDYSAAIDLKPTWNVYYRRGLIYVKQSQLQKALADLNQSVRLNRDQADPLRARGYLKHKMGDVEGACVDMIRVYEMGFDDAKEWIRKNCG